MKRDCLRIGVERDPARSMTEQFLGDLYIRPVLSQQRRMRVAESMPADCLHNPDLQGSWPDESSHDALAPIRISAASSRTREYPVIRSFVSRVLTP